MLFRQTVTWRPCHAKPVQVTTQCSTKGYSMRRLVGIRPVLLAAAPFFLALGLVLPLIRFEKLYFFDETPSLLEIVASLWSGGDIPLALIVGIVSMVLPILKIIGIAAEATAAGGGTGSSVSSSRRTVSVQVVDDGRITGGDRGSGGEDHGPGGCFYSAGTLVLRSVNNNFGPSSLPSGKCVRPEINVFA